MIFSDGQQCAFRQNQATFWLETFGLETFGLETFGQETSGRVPFWGPAWQSSSLDYGPDFSTELCVEVLSEATLKPWPLDLVLGSSCGSAVVPDFSSVQEERWRRGDGHGYGYGLLRAYLATWLLPHGWSTATLYGQPCGWWSLSGPRCQTTPWTVWWRWQNTRLDNVLTKKKKTLNKWWVERFKIQVPMVAKFHMTPC